MVVQKFGGTSVADPEAIRRLIEIVRTARTRDGRGPVVVVSAMSRVTDALLAIATTAGAGRPGDFARSLARALDAPLPVSGSALELQVAAYRHAEHVELATRLADHAVGAVKTILQTRV